MTYPDTVTTVRVTARYVAPGGSYATGWVTFTPSAPAATPGALLVATERAVLDAYGRIAVDLRATDDPDWAAPGLMYVVTEFIDGRAPRAYSIEVPAAAAESGLDLASLNPAPATPVTRADVIAYMGGPAAVSWTDEEIDAALATETVAQRNACDVPDPPDPDMNEALCRRVAVNLAKRRLTLGVMVGDQESGPVRPARRDPEIVRLEAPYRRTKTG